jgi:hypothetical protein
MSRENVVQIQECVQHDLFSSFFMSRSDLRPRTRDARRFDQACAQIKQALSRYMSVRIEGAAAIELLLIEFRNLVLRAWASRKRRCHRGLKHVTFGEVGFDEREAKL